MIYFYFTGYFLAFSNPKYVFVYTMLLVFFPYTNHYRLQQHEVAVFYVYKNKHCSNKFIQKITKDCNYVIRKIFHAYASDFLYFFFT